ncbi:FumA C-terminus/TtdB family hydratase beta subunit [Thermatribacter velox]|jgi:fumarate hydratase subunit beta|uniref:FumA C-terminus/TtdB family hydratase beta subunit n=1 Tax=Thermatribacter velox TaxID=3039681 RepID=A0ABZ2YA13_9BACT
MEEQAEKNREFVLKTPLSVDDTRNLRVGDIVYLSGDIYVARDATHRRMLEDLKKGKELPFEVKGATIYYAGPTPTPPGKVIGSVGPTTSSRMDATVEELLKLGVRATIGKGARSEEVKKLLEKHLAVYFIACGGAGAYLAQFVLRRDVLAYEDLGAQALLRLFVRDFPLIVAYDSFGGDLFEEGKIRNRGITLY